MDIHVFLRLVELLAWPAVALVVVFVVRPHLRSALSGAKIKLTVFGQSIETTLPELQQIIEEQTGEALTGKHILFLTTLLRDGSKPYASGVAESEDRKFLRPLRNAGLVLTVPRNAFLRDANAIELSALGRLFLRARGTQQSSGGI